MIWALPAFLADLETPVIPAGPGQEMQFATASQKKKNNHRQLPRCRVIDSTGPRLHPVRAGGLRPRSDQGSFVLA